MSKVIVVGGGAAGMFAATICGKQGDQVLLFEKNEKLGKKLYITGKGRCNFTNAGTMEELLDAMASNEKFMYSSLYGWNNFDMMDFMEEQGVDYKIERGNRVFPASDHAQDVIDGIRRSMRAGGVKVHLNTAVEKLCEEQGAITGVIADGEFYEADKVIVATGGLSYPTTGSTGDGYQWAKDTGHKVTELYPSLVPFNARESYVKDLQGLSLKNVSLSIYDQETKLYEEFGEMMFTHFGVTGPLVLTASAKAAPVIKKKQVQAFIDLKPALSQEQLDHRLVRMFDEGKTKQFKNVVGQLFPGKLTPVMIQLSEIAPERKVNEITKEERESFGKLIKALPFTITGLRDFKEAIITKGGIQVKDINPKTMESKLVKGLYFVGEVLDVDAVTGGFNLQVAWSTAYAAAMAK